MLYYLFEYLGFSNSSVPGAGLFAYISFRAMMAAGLSLLLSLFLGKRIIAFLKRRLIGEAIRTTGPESHFSKKGTPTMGGIIIIVSLVIPVLLFGRLANINVALLLLGTLWMGAIGFIDDYIKVFKKNKAGLPGKYKIVGQVLLGIIIAAVLWTNPNVRAGLQTNAPIGLSVVDYSLLVPSPELAWLVYIPMIVLVMTATTNAVNLTDGLDGLASGTTAIVGGALGILAYMAGSGRMANYLNIVHVPGSAETLIFIAALIGACVGFLWYNTFPAQVFMGDTGSMALGGAVAVQALLIRMELVLPILCGVFFAESASVIMQVSYFKYTRKKFGEGRRIFKMTPLHHHYELKGLSEPKIVSRFWIVTLLLAIVTLTTLKLR